MKKYHDWDTTIAAYTIEISKIGSVKENDEENKPLAEAYMNRGYARCFASAKSENYERAIEDFSMAIALITDDELNAELKAACYVRRAYAYWLNKNFERAKADCEQKVINENGEENVKAFAHELYLFRDRGQRTENRD
jgi:tetratricopeptide (TPR) repeat protein